LTREKLESLHILRKDIKSINDLIRRENDRATSTVGNIEANPGGGGFSDKTGEGGVNLADLEERKKKLQRKYQANYTEIMVFASSITDPVLRKIIAGRCINDYKWTRVAVEVGGGNTEDTVRQRYNRFVKNLQKK
jgi:hypothetical protein